MATKIKSITVISESKPFNYEVGETYSMLFLAKIENQSRVYADSLHPIYTGYTHANEIVFAVINAPVVVQYDPE